jgi:hypothetical protein
MQTWVSLSGESITAVLVCDAVRGWLGGVEFDLRRVAVVERVRDSHGVVRAEFDEGVLDSRRGIGIPGDFRGVGYRNFPVFPMTFCPSWTLQLRSCAVHTMVLISGVSSGFLTGCRGS